jgi:hypothetical protein
MKAKGFMSHIDAVHTDQLWLQYEADSAEEAGEVVQEDHEDHEQNRFDDLDDEMLM